MNIIIKSEKIQELEVIVDEHYNKEVLPIYLKKYGVGILQIMDREIQEMKRYLIYEYIMQCLKEQEPEVDTEYLN
ncbi:hypothetical protein [Bacteroides fragilis]|jgi:bifunctional DNase/RNase|uniref:Uncharacterized protein n=1 Tax=Bacteroides fragilis TaxID=817 RepID=A0AAP9D0N1_BACFG|nr:hypothetical protein [Bacteroides fragilis]MBV4152345.1 hypothetical protein [Bacteroides fragilis]MCE8578991.1 hypothetical protein [Bacteroides fragilis]MCE8649744.1 hypothetical protein [Bacteroides fragilis]MCM0368818.1 hypothetical protein [Bacteroides fragilis]MCS2597569.1 hypothetical protein [Bacteroides fragilis]